MSSILRVPRDLVRRLIVPKRTLAQDLCHKRQRDLQYKIRKLVFDLSTYKKYGLYTHDVIDCDDPVVSEALRRLPKDVLDARNFRLIRAQHVDFLKIYLPREKWVTYEQDQDYRYLQPYIREIEAERMEIYEFGCVNYSDDDWPSGEIK